MPYFNSASLPEPKPEYVAWIDVMGTQATMSRSVDAAGNFIFKLHVAALEAPRATVTLYPVMDGLYASSPSQEDILAFVNALYASVAKEFNAEAQAKHRFLIRGALAFGHVIHGGDITASASEILAKNSPYRSAILLGMPVVQAHGAEPSAPPFGMAVHDSARAFCPSGSKPLHVFWWRWSTPKTKKTWDALKGHLGQHFKWCKERSGAIGYPLDRIDAHKAMADQYFAE